MKKIIIPALILFMCSCGPKKDATNETKQDSTHVAAAVYQCPMDCEHGKTYDKPGQCPVCGMDLEIKT